MRVRPLFDMVEKPPLGIVPRHYHDERRIHEIIEGIVRYHAANEEVPFAWIEELYELRKRVDEHYSSKLTAKTLSGR